MNSPKLSQQELENLDAMIAYMEKSNMPVLKGFISSIWHAVTNAATDVGHAVTSVASNAVSSAENVASNVTNAVTNLAHGNFTAAAKNVAQTCPQLVTAATSVAEAAGANAKSVAKSEELISLIQKLSGDPTNAKGFTLQQLRDIRTHNISK